MRHITFVINGLIPSWKFNQKTAAKFLAGDKCEFYRTSARGDAIRIAATAARNGADIIVSVGGDGTLNEVANGIMGSELEKKPLLGIIPSGTGNDYVRTLGIPKKISSALEIIARGNTRTVDLIHLEYRKFSELKESRYCINVADIGIGGEVVELINKSSKILGADLSYIVSSVRAFLSFTKKEIQFISRWLNFYDHILILCMAKGKYFGSGLGIAPHAAPDNGKIAIVRVADVSVMEYIRFLPDIKKCKKLVHPAISYEEVTSCIIEPRGVTSLLEIDGELVGKLPLSAQVVPGALRVFIP